LSAALFLKIHHAVTYLQLIGFLFHSGPDETHSVVLASLQLHKVKASADVRHCFGVLIRLGLNSCFKIICYDSSNFRNHTQRMENHADQPG
jgi:hypothetical protein